MMVFVLLTLQRYLTHPELFCFTPDLSNSHLLGLDLPGQAMEAEEIIKQLDMEQVEEMPMGTATSSPGQCAPPHPTAMSPYHSHAERGEEDEEEDVVTRVDLPPVTGTQLKLLQEAGLSSVCLSLYLSICLTVFICLSICLSLYLCVHKSICLYPSVSLSVCPSVCLSFCLS